MQRTDNTSKKSFIFKYLLLFVAVFTLALPITDRDCQAAGKTNKTYRVDVKKGYLALRTAKKYDASNEIGELYTGDTIEISDTKDSKYWYGYSPKLKKYGYVNKNYLIEDASYPTWTVKVKKGYLALRTKKAYDAANEIGELYTGDTVQVTDSSDSKYWYVYSSKLNKYGYVNKNYLTQEPLELNWTVKVKSGYLALRTEKKYDAANEIGKLYNGDVVEVHNTNDSTFWYVYSQKLGKGGYVNKNYLYQTDKDEKKEEAKKPEKKPYVVTKKVSVKKGYLALRTEKKYDAANEIGKLYTGDVVEIHNTNDSTYWYVYSQSLGKGGYVNKNYLCD